MLPRKSAIWDGLRENLLAGIIGPAEMFRALQRAGDIDGEKTFEEYRDDLDMRGMAGSDEDEPPQDNVVSLVAGIQEGLNGRR